MLSFQLFQLFDCFNLFFEKTSVKENQQNNINDSYKDSVLVSELFLVISKHTFIYFF